MTTKTAKRADVRAADAASRPSLADLQAEFQRAVLDGDEQILARLPANSRTTPDVLFGVYRNAYLGRLVEVARHEYPVLAAYLGDEIFNAELAAYYRAHPSRSPNARWAAYGLPDYLATAAIGADHPEVADLARLERALADAFDATDAPTLDLPALVEIAGASWDTLVFEPNPSAQLLELSSNAFAIWQAIKAETESPAAAKLGESQALFIWRQENSSRVRVMGSEEAMLWTEAVRGTTFGRLGELAATFDSLDAALRVAGYLKGWIETAALAAARQDASP